MKRAIAIDGGPRKGWNTSILLEKALEGAKSRGAEVETVRLYDLSYRGCRSCFYCKRAATYREGKCAMRDDLTPVLERCWAADVLIMGSPIYLSDVTGEMRSFWERLIFAVLAYDPVNRCVLPPGKKIDCGLIYTMNIPADMAEQYGYGFIYESNSRFLGMLNGKVEHMTANDTYQFDDYTKYHAPMFDAAHKKKMREEQFPHDCERAFEMGARLAGGE